MAEQFVRWGYSDASRVLVGVIEIGGGLALLLPQTAFRERRFRAAWEAYAERVINETEGQP